MTRTTSQVVKLFEQNLYPVHQANWSDSNREEYVPYDIIAPHEAQALRNHGQTLQRLAERGGLGWGEILAIITGKPWRFACKIGRDEAKSAVLAYIKK